MPPVSARHGEGQSGNEEDQGSRDRELKAPISERENSGLAHRTRWESGESEKEEREHENPEQNGRASCRERVYVLV